MAVDKSHIEEDEWDLENKIYGNAINANGLFFRKPRALYRSYDLDGWWALPEIEDRDKEHGPGFNFSIKELGEVKERNYVAMASLDRNIVEGWTNGATASMSIITPTIGFWER